MLTYTADLYIARLRFEFESGHKFRLGYNNSEHWAFLSVEQMTIAGFCLAQDKRGVRGIAVSSTGGVLSRWIGDHKTIPKRRLVISSDNKRVIKFLKGGFNVSVLISPRTSPSNFQ